MDYDTRAEELNQAADSSFRHAEAALPSPGPSFAMKTYQARRARDRAFGDLAPLLFGEAAWDILLDLHAAWAKGQEIRVSSACAASGAPDTTALRYIRALEHHDLVTRRPSPTDGRAVVLQLTPKALRIMQSWEASCVARFGML